MKPAGVILAGGRARRFGSDKALALLHGRPLIAHVIAALAPQTCALAIASGSTPGRFAAYGLPELADPLADAGPLAGVLAGLAWAATLTPRPTHLLTAPADSPFLPANLARRLAECAGDGVAVATSDGVWTPVVAVWPLLTTRALAGLVLNDGVRRVGEAARHLDARSMEIGEAAPCPLFDIDTLEDLALAARLGGR